MEWKILRTSFYGWGIKNLRLFVNIYFAQNDERVAKKKKTNWLLATKN